MFPLKQSLIPGTRLLAAGVLLFGAIAPLTASQLAQYSFAADASPTFIASGLTAGTATNASLSAFRPGDTANAGTNYGVPVLNLSPSGYPALANAVSAASFFAVLLSASPGARFTATNLAFNAASALALNVRGCAVFSSLDNFSGCLFSNVFSTARPQMTAFSIPLSAAFQNQTNLTFRFYFWAEGGNKQIDLNNLTVNGSVDFTIPPAPAGLSATAQTNQVVLKWNPAPGASSYIVKRSAAHGGPYAVIASGISATNYNDPQVVGAAPLYYVVSGVGSAGEGANSLQASALPANFLKTSRCDVRDQGGAGQVVSLRGVNLGGWLYFEGWMCPGTLGTNSNPLQPDVETNLIARFGVATKNALVDTYRSNWITAPDLDVVAAAGMNLVRVPFTYSVFQNQPHDPSVPLNSVDWKTDAEAFKYLDWVVNECAQRGIYVIFDYHNPEGGATTNGLYGYTSYQDRFVEIWRRMAARYVGNPTVAGYDLVNESAGAPNLDDVWDRAYQAIRAEDPDHIVVAEYWSISGTTEVMDAYSWENVMASMHDYWNTGETVYAELVTARAAPTNATVCPLFVGEFIENTDSPARLRNYNDSGAPWASWTLKTKNQQSWSLFNALNNGPTSSDIPDLSTDSATTISNKWAKWATRSPVTIYQPTMNRLASPIARNDVLSVPTNGVLFIPTNSLLANDTSLSQSNQMTLAPLPARSAHGTLTATNGGYWYQADPGFLGTDSFSYYAVDARLHLTSAYPATVRLMPPVPAAPAFLRAASGSGQITLVWGGVTNAATYSVKRALSAGGPYVTVASGLTATNFTDTLVNRGFLHYYVVTATNNFGEGDPSPEALAALIDEVRYPVADAFVRGGASATNNYGTNATLELKLDPNADFNREAFLRFNVAGLSNAPSVQLSLTPTAVSSALAAMTCALVASDAWMETGLTWNLKPASGAVVAANWTGWATNTPSVAEITSVVNVEAAGDGLLSLRLIPLASGVNLNLGSREQTDPSLRPQLLVTTNPAPLLIRAQAGPNSLTLAWPAGYAACRLLVQTNHVGQGLGTNWLDAGVVTNPLVLPVGPQNSSVFYRLQTF